MGSETRLCLCNRGKLGTTRVMVKRSIIDPGETWIILHEMTVERNYTMLVTVSAPLITILKRMRNY